MLSGANLNLLLCFLLNRHRVLSEINVCCYLTFKFALIRHWRSTSALPYSVNGLISNM